MICNILKFKAETINWNCIDTYEVTKEDIELENGEIILDDWLVWTVPFKGWEEPKKFPSGYYIRIINLNQVDVFETDIYLTHSRIQLIQNNNGLYKYIVF